MWYWFLIPLSFFAVVLALRIVFWRRWGAWGYGFGHGPAAQDVGADEILRRRLARGEIDEAAYARLQSALKR
jgi:uncharacterized membrane protein